MARAFARSSLLPFSVRHLTTDRFAVGKAAWLSPRGLSQAHPSLPAALTTAISCLSQMCHGRSTLSGSLWMRAEPQQGIPFPFLPFSSERLETGESSTLTPSLQGEEVVQPSDARPQRLIYYTVKLGPDPKHHFSSRTAFRLCCKPYALVTGCCLMYMLLHVPYRVSGNV